MNKKISNPAILCTRFIDFRELAQAEARGIRVDVVPFIRTNPVLEGTLDSELQVLSKLPVLAVFTSKHAVTAVADILSKTGLKSRLDWKVACLDRATLQSIQTSFPALSTVAIGQDAEHLAERISDYIDQSPVEKDELDLVIFNGDRSLKTLINYCKSAGLNVQTKTVYRTELTPVTVRKHYNGIIFMSPSAVESYFQLNTFPLAAAAFCIGKTTQRAFVTAAPDVKDVVRAAEHTPKAILDALIAYYER